MARALPIPAGQSLKVTRKAAGQAVALACAEAVAVQAVRCWSWGYAGWRGHGELNDYFLRWRYRAQAFLLLQAEFRIIL